MKIRRFAKPIAAIVMAVGVISVGAAVPADAASQPSYTTLDTGWDKR